MGVAQIFSVIEVTFCLSKFAIPQSYSSLPTNSYHRRFEFAYLALPGIFNWHMLSLSSIQYFIRKRNVDFSVDGFGLVEINF